VQDNYAFATSDLGGIANQLNIPLERHGAIIDSGATSHFCPDFSKFQNYVPIDPQDIRTEDGSSVSAVGRGDVQIDLPLGDKRTAITLRNTLYAPKMAFTLISTNRIASAGFAVLFEDRLCKILSPEPNRKVIATIPQTDGLYSLAARSQPIANVAAVKRTVYDLHKALGHVSQTAVAHAVKDGLVEGVELDSTSIPAFCDACTKAKATRQPFPEESKNRARTYGELVHTDLWGPAQTPSTMGCSYYISFTDDFSRETTVTFLKQKSEALTAFKHYEATVTTQHPGTRLRKIRSDRGGEYLSAEFDQYLKDRGIQRQLTVHDSPQQNGVAERLNRTLVEHARAMLLAHDLPKSLWAEAINYATWLKNRLPSKAIPGHTPYELVHGSKPNLAQAHEFGARVYVHLLGVGKLEAKAEEGIFVGVDEQSKGYRILWPHRRRVSVERNVSFVPSSVVVAADVPDEGDSEAAPNASTTNTNVQNVTPQIQMPSTPPKALQRPITPPAPRSSQTRHPPGYYAALNRGEAASLAASDVVEPVEPYFEDTPLTNYALAAADPEPTLKQALSGPDAAEWQEAIDYELGQLEKLRTWDIVDVPPKRINLIPCHFVLATKCGPNGEKLKLRARLVANGQRQQYGIDYNETFAPTSNMTAIRAVLATAARRDWEIHQVDIKSAYLHAEVKEDIYMRPPPGYLKPEDEGKVLKLLRSLYGLKQAGFEWSEELEKFFMDVGFTRSQVDRAVYLKRFLDEHTVITVSVDDMAVTSRYLQHIEAFKNQLRERFEISDLGELTWLLGLKVERNRQARMITLSQNAYVDTILERFRLTEAKSALTPMDASEVLSADQSPTTEAERDTMQDVPYQRGIGSLMYAATSTRPDIAFAVAILSQFMRNPGRTHWEAAKHVMRYLKGSADLGLTIGASDTGLEAYVDADWASQPHRHSMSGYVIFLHGGPIAWSARKQSIIALSTAEAEYIALTTVAREILYLQTLLSELYEPVDLPTTIYCNNQSAIALATNGKFYARTKHIDICFHFVRDCVRNGVFELEYCPTDENVADAFTKPLSRLRHQKLRDMMGIGSARGGVLESGDKE
jgi:transposase InsO family protein